MSKISALLGDTYEQRRRDLLVRKFDLHGFEFRVRVPLSGETDAIHARISSPPADAVEAAFLKISEPLQKYRADADDSMAFTDDDIVLTSTGEDGKRTVRSLRESARMQVMTSSRITEYIRLLVAADGSDALAEITYDELNAEWPLQVQLALVDKIGEVIAPTYQEARGK